MSPKNQRRSKRSGEIACVPRSMKDQVHRFQTWTKLGTYNVGSVNHYYGFLFSLSDLPSTKETDVFALFRQYRINRVTLKFVPLMNVNTAGDWLGPDTYNAMTFNSMTSCAICYDDAGAPTSENDVLRYQNVTLHPTMGKPWEISFSPKVKLDGDNLNRFPAMGGQWIDTASPTAPHYGLKVCIPSVGGGAENDLGIHIYCKYDYSLRTFM